MIEIYGWHAVLTMLEQHPQSIRNITILTGRDDKRSQRIADLAEAEKISIERLGRAAMQKKLPHAMQHQGVMAACDKINTYTISDAEAWVENSEKPVLFLILDGVQDPHNLGACLRSAAAFSVTAVIIPKDRAVSLTPTVIKVACGAAQTVPVVEVTNLAQAMASLQKLGVWTVGLDMMGEQSITKLDLNGNLALVLGGEGGGLRRLTTRHCDFLASIPMTGDMESLNVSVSCGIALYEVRRPRK